MPTPWQIRDEDFPAEGSPRDRLRHALGYAVLAPSGHNTQPWRFTLGDWWVELHADRERRLPVVDPQDRELIIACGAALDHFRLALARYGMGHVVSILPDPLEPDLLARVHLTGEHEPPDAETMRLFQAIPRRHTNRARFEDEPVPAAALLDCAARADEAGARLHLLTDPRDLDRVADLVAEGDRAQFADPGFRHELARWVKSSHGGDQDGVSARGFGMPDALSPLAALAIRTVDMGASVAGRDRTLAEHAPALALLTTPGDDPADWMAAGQALSRVLLCLTGAGLSAAFLNEPVEVADLRPKLRALVPTDGMPQLLFRIGRAPEAPAAARRPLEEVVREVDTPLDGEAA